MAVLFADRIRVLTSTVGTGTISLGAATTGFRTFAQAVTSGNLASGCTVYYAVQDGINWECGTGIYTSGAETLTRVVSSSSSGGTTLLSLSGGAQVALTETALAAITALFTGGTIDNVAIGSTTPAVGTFTNLYGNLSLNVGTSAMATSANITINAANAQVKQVGIQTGSTRWTFGSTATSETGSNVGSDFNISNWTDAGAFVSSPLIITRATGVTTLTNVAIATGTINNTIIGASTPAAGTFTALNATSMPTPGAIGTTVAQGLTSISFGSTIGALINLYSTQFGIGITSNELTMWTSLNVVFRYNAYAGAALFSFSGSTSVSNTLIFNQTAGVAAPSITTTRSVGTKLVLSPLQGTGSSDYALGINTNTLWIGVPTSAQSFSFYAASTAIATISGIGVMTCASTFTATGGIINTTIGASTPQSGAFTTITASGAVSGTIAPLASPSLTGTPLSTTATAGTNTTQIATTAFVHSLAAFTSVTLGWFSGAVLVNGTYYFTIYAPFAGTITSMDWYSGTGTFTANVGIIASGGVTGTATSVTGLSAVAITSTQTNTSASAANVFAVANVVQVIITSAASSPTNAWLTLLITKT